MLRDASAIAEQQQADYFCIYCPDLHKCRDTRSFYDLQRACECRGRVILLFNFKFGMGTYAHVP